MRKILLLLLFIALTSCKLSNYTASEGNRNAVPEDSTDPANIPKTGTSMALTNPLTSPGSVATPTITVSGVTSGQTVKLYTDSSCSHSVGIATATSGSVQIITSALSFGSYLFYTNSTKDNKISACSIAQLSYIYQLQKYSVKVKWSANREKNVNSLLGGYTVYYGTTPFFNTNNASSIDVPSTATEVAPTSTTITNLNAGTYYVKIQAYYKTYKSAYTTEASIVVP